MRFAFNHCANVRRIIGLINIASNIDVFGAFTGCAVLEEVDITSLACSISFADSPHFKRDKILYMITNRAGTTTIIITLHADAKARLTPEDIALASSKNITIA